jgi:hypothetical protein
VNIVFTILAIRFLSVLVAVILPLLVKESI